MDWQRGPPTKRYRPNEAPSASRQWINPPPNPNPGTAMIHPSRQSQIMHPGPPPQNHIPPSAPYYPQTLPPPPPQAPYYNTNLPPQPGPPQPVPMNPMMHSNNNHNNRPARVRRHGHGHGHANRSLDPRRPRRADMSNNVNNNRPNPTLLNILHVASDDNGNFGAFAVTLNQIYGPKMIDNLPFGQSSLDSIAFDGRLKVKQVIEFLIATMNSPKKRVRVLELTALAASDKKSYDTFVSFWTKSDRLAVVDKEYNMGLLLYFIPPKLIHEKYDHKKKGKVKVSIGELLNINQQAVTKDCIWMISIESSQKYLIWKQKSGEKEIKKKEMKKQKVKAKRKKALNEASDVLSDISLTDSDSNQSDLNYSDSNQDSDDEYNLKFKKKKDDIVKSDLVISLEKLYKMTGQRLPD